MHEYAQFASSIVKKRDGDSFVAGQTLMAECLEQMDVERHPPILLVLWATPSFFPFRDLIAGIRVAAFKRLGRDIPLVGCSAAACAYQSDLIEDGAVLGCIASRYGSAKVTTAPLAHTHVAKAAEDLIKSLRLLETQPNSPGSGRFLVVFAPGLEPGSKLSNFVGPELVDCINAAVESPLQIFGGIASTGVGNQLASSCQFTISNVTTCSIVAALVETDAVFGLGISSGLETTEETIVLTSSSTSNGRVFRVPSKMDSFYSMAGSYPLGRTTDTGKYDIVTATIIDDELHTSRLMESGDRLVGMKPTRSSLVGGVRDARDEILRRERQQSLWLRGVVAVGCTARYRLIRDGGFHAKPYFAQFEKSFPNAQRIMAFLDGEIGTTLEGPEFQHWSLSEVLLFDSIYPASQLRIGFQAITESAATEQVSVLQAAIRAVDRVKSAGYEGAMISLVLRDGPKSLIVSLAATPGPWEDHILPETRRRMDESDILTVVVNSRRSHFVVDAQNDSLCKQQLARKADIRSFFATPLFDDNGDVLGVMQIDCGDRRDRDLGIDEERLLRSLGARAQSGITRAMRAAQRLAFEKLDSAADEDFAGDAMSVSHCLAVAEAVFQMMATDGEKTSYHLRLRRPGTTHLDLVCGAGPWHSKLTLTGDRNSIDYTLDDSPTSRTMAENRIVIVNDANEDEESLLLRKRFSGSSLEEPLANVGSFANFPLRDVFGEPIGIVNFTTDKPWFFTQWRLKILQAVARHISRSLATIDISQDQIRTLHSVATYRSIAFPARETGYLDTISRLLDALRTSTRASACSCFMYDPIKRNYVLRGESGWFDASCVNTLSYGPSKGLIGKLCVNDGVVVLDKTAPFSSSQLAELWKHCDHVYGPCSDDACVHHSFVTLPIHSSSEHIGIVILYHRSNDENQWSFRVQPTDDLIAFSSMLSTAILRAWDVDERCWSDGEQKRVADFADWLETCSSVRDLLMEAEDRIASVFRASKCVLYVCSEDQSELVTLLGEHIPRDGSLEWRTLASQVDDFRRIGHSDEENSSGIIDVAHIPAGNSRSLRLLELPLDNGSSHLGHIGVLRIQWEFDPAVANGDLPRHHDPKRFHDVLDRLIQKADALTGEAQRASLESQSRELTRKFDAYAGYVLQAYHELMNNVAQLRAILADQPDTNVGINVERAQTLIDSQETLLRRMLSSSRESRKGRVNLANLVDSIIENVEVAVQLDNLGATVYRDFEPGLTAWADSEQIRQVLDTIVRNAISAMEAVAVSGTRFLLIEIRRLEDKDCEIAVTDTGGGIKQEVIDAINSDVESSIRSSHGGAGIGLKVARMLCENNGGKLILNAGAGLGTTVRIVLRDGEQ